LNGIGQEGRREASAFVAGGTDDATVVRTGQAASVANFAQPVPEREIGARWWIAALVVGALMWIWFLTILF